ncbi:MAG TPA: 16S rRNA (cytosine(1402)-N(4))-methyltransferase RsmH [Candidatus Eremiobacteraeota bacterium]|nr:16S rRNA (cytosine(1402)-N(4))-methyltransferase RsmH [Candidatus Eremiobacteraeota bacterium]
MSQEECLVHTPVLLKESISYLNCLPGKMILDCTLGGGGHSKEILKSILPGGTLISLDCDIEAIKSFEDFARDFSLNLKLVKGNFSELDEILLSFGIKEVDGILFDLGISSTQLNDARRGFSFQVDSPLDMRMDSNMSLTASHIVNDFSEDDLSYIIYHYGEEKHARKIAREIVKTRKISRILSTKQLSDIVVRAVSRNLRKRRKIHPSTKTFMGLRIFLNKELDTLEKGLKKALKVLKSGGRLVVISFHSLEDRIVKRIFKDASMKKCLHDLSLCKCEGFPLVRLLNKKPLFPGKEEELLNPRSRSARLRALEKF